MKNAMKYKYNLTNAEADKKWLLINRSVNGTGRTIKFKINVVKKLRLLFGKEGLVLRVKVQVKMKRKKAIIVSKNKTNILFHFYIYKNNIIDNLNSNQMYILFYYKKLTFNK